jgi:hypothetical protein
MPATYEPIATNTLGSATSSVTFSSISASYTDLVLVCNVIAVSGAAFDTWIRFNGDTGSNYSFTSMNGTGSAAQSFRASNQTSMAVDRQASVRSTSRVIQIVNIQNYSNATTYKTSIVRGSAPSDAVEALVGLWRSTAAINEITFSNSTSGNFDTGSTFTLYGIKSA